MTYGYMRNYEDRVRRAVNTPDQAGQCALWQGGMEPNIPVGSQEGVANSMRKAVAGGEREQRGGGQRQSGSPTGRWCTSCGRCGRRSGEDNQLGREFPRLTYTAGRRRGLDAAGERTTNDPRRS